MLTKGYIEKIEWQYFVGFVNKVFKLLPKNLKMGLYAALRS